MMKFTAEEEAYRIMFEKQHNRHIRKFKAEVNTYEILDTGKVFRSLKKYTDSERELLGIEYAMIMDYQDTELWCLDLDEHINASLREIGGDFNEGVGKLFRESLWALYFSHYVGSESNVAFWKSKAGLHARFAMDMINDAIGDGLKTFIEILVSDRPELELLYLLHSNE